MADRLQALPIPIWGQGRLRAIRDKILTNKRFLDWAAAFPLTRSVARRRAAKLFDLCAGFVYSQILFACVKLDLFAVLREGPRSSAALAQRLGLSLEASTRLLTAAAALRLVEKRGEDLFGLGPLGAAVAANPGIGAMVEHHAHLYADLADPIALLREEKADTALSGYWPYAGSGNPAQLKDDQVAAYSALMGLSLPLVAEEVLDAYPLGRHRRLLDVGGGEGVFIAAASVRAPKLGLMLFDLPAVTERAKTQLAAAGLDHAMVFGGDFLADPLPRGADVITLVRVILDHGDQNALRILRAAREALPPDGVLLVAEQLADTPGAEAMSDAYFGFYLMAMGRGRPRSFPQLKALLTAAGFDRVSLRRGGRVLRTGIVIAHPQS